MEDFIGSHETVKLSKDLDETLNLFDRLDELDHSDFSVANCINSIFPTESSLSSIDTVLLKLSHQIKLLDKDIRDAVRLQTDAGPKAKAELMEVKSHIQVCSFPLPLPPGTVSQNHSD